MSDLVKWAIKIAIAVACIALVVVLFNTTGLLNGIAPALNNATAWLGKFSGYLVQGRKLLNNFIVPELLTVLLTFSFLKPLLKVAITTTRSIIDSIYGKSN